MQFMSQGSVLVKGTFTHCALDDTMLQFFIVLKPDVPVSNVTFID